MTVSNSFQCLVNSYGILLWFHLSLLQSVRCKFSIYWWLSSIFVVSVLLTRWIYCKLALSDLYYLKSYFNVSANGRCHVSKYPLIGAGPQVLKINVSGSCGKWIWFYLGHNSVNIQVINHIGVKFRDWYDDQLPHIWCLLNCLSRQKIKQHTKCA